jgi:hypothetical protein
MIDLTPFLHPAMTINGLVVLLLFLSDQKSNPKNRPPSHKAMEGRPSYAKAPAGQAG